MKIFISSPMKNLTEEQIRKNRDEAINEIKKRFGNEKFEIIDSYFKEYALKDASINTTIYCLGRAILKLSDADLVVFAKGWETARGFVSWLIMNRYCCCSRSTSLERALVVTLAEARERSPAISPSSCAAQSLNPFPSSRRMGSSSAS